MATAALRVWFAGTVRVGVVGVGSASGRSAAADSVSVRDPRVPAFWTSKPMVAASPRRSVTSLGGRTPMSLTPLLIEVDATFTAGESKQRWNVASAQLTSELASRVSSVPVRVPGSRRPPASAAGR